MLDHSYRVLSEGWDQDNWSDPGICQFTTTNNIALGRDSQPLRVEGFRFAAQGS